MSVFSSTNQSTCLPPILVVTNLGIHADNDADMVVPVDQQQLTQDGNDWIVTFAAGTLAEGVYQLEVLPTLTDEAGQQLDGNRDGVAGDSFVFAGNSDNSLYKLTSEFNGDFGVSVFDFSTFAYWFGEPAPTAPSYVDMNRDGGVSVFDFSFLADNFSIGVTFPTSLALVPNVAIPSNEIKPLVENEANDIVDEPTFANLPDWAERQTNARLPTARPIDQWENVIAEDLLDTLGMPTVNDIALELLIREQS
jgi:hypothetical protein